MAKDRWIDINTAKKLLKNTCDFLEEDKSGVADFKIANGKEAVIMSMYSGAFFPLNNLYKFKFHPMGGFWSHREPLTLVSYNDEIFSTSELLPIFSLPISSYFQLFSDLNKPKFLFLVDLSKYKTRTMYTNGRGVEHYELHLEKPIKELLQKIESAGLHPSDCLIWLSGAGGTFGEGFWEYISGIVLRNKGYFVSCYSVDGGDLFAYYLPHFLRKLMDRDLLRRGAFVEELEMLSAKNIQSQIDVNENIELVCIEAESSEMRTRSGSGNAGFGQVLTKYLAYFSGYTHAFVSGPFTKLEDVSQGYLKNVGLISCDENGNLIFYKAKEYQKPRKEKIDTIEKVIKCSLLRNLTFDERTQLIGVKPTSLHQYFDKMLSLEIDVILNRIEEKL